MRQVMLFGKKYPALTQFRVTRIALRRPLRSKHLRVIVLKNRSDLIAVANRNENYGKATDGLMGLFIPYEFSHCIGDIILWSGSRKLELVAMHESIHAAFNAATFQTFRFDQWFPPSTYEEFIVRCSEEIFRQVRAGIQNWI